MTELLAFAGGVLFGAAVVLLVHVLRKKDTREIARALVSETEAEKVRDLEVLLGRVRDSFGALSQDALKASTGELLKLARENLDGRVQLSEKDLEGKKKLIEQTLGTMRTELLKLQDQVARFERDRASQYGEVSNQLRCAADQTSRLQDTADRLRSALASTKARGQWGERMAEDVLRLAGFVEGVNYLKQKALETAAGRPDYTFPLPHGQKVNMDVKFPLNSYMRYLETDSDLEREARKGQFLRDVRTRIKEVTTRDYINPEDRTVDYVLVFIPNEQVYAFIHQQDPGLIDEALKNKVILCSPFTLFAILAVIRQALDNFSMEKTANEMLKLINVFRQQWGLFTKSLEKVGKKLDETHREFEALTTTRKRQLERQVDKIEELRQSRGIEPGPLPADAEAAALEDGETKD
jgi:DNA recombination protein RmuC